MKPSARHCLNHAKKERKGGRLPALRELLTSVLHAGMRIEREQFTMSLVFWVRCLTSD